MNTQSLTSLVFMVAMFAIFYFMLIRPQRKRDKQVRDMRASLKKGDEVVTIGGITGKIIKVNDDVVIIELEHAKQRLKMQKWSIHSVINPSDIVEEPETIVESTVEEVEAEEIKTEE